MRARLPVLALVALLSACGKSPPPFERDGAAWKYRGTPIADVDASTFTPLTDHYAKDRHSVYYADTYRDSKEYFTVSRVRVTPLEGADAASFRYIDRGYAKDRRYVWLDGERHDVKDAPSFSLLDYVFTRDAATAYCHMKPIAGSDPASFTVVSSHYAKDRARVYWCDIELAGSPPYVKWVAVDADLATFATTDDTPGTDAKDARGRFAKGERVRP
ncbi:MAG: DKNYY domain-containing protein [Burkholderiales bacterium]